MIDKQAERSLDIPGYSLSILRKFMDGSDAWSDWVVEDAVD